MTRETLRKKDKTVLADMVLEKEQFVNTLQAMPTGTMSPRQSATGLQVPFAPGTCKSTETTRSR